MISIQTNKSGIFRPQNPGNTLFFFAPCNNAGEPTDNRNQSDSNSFYHDSENTLLPPTDSLLNDSAFGNNELRLPVSQPVSPPTSEIDVVIHQMTGYGQDEDFGNATADPLKAVVNSAGF